MIPWKVAGRLTDRQTSADDVVQTTGWVFNNETGGTLTLADFVKTGDAEAYTEEVMEVVRRSMGRPIRASRPAAD